MNGNDGAESVPGAPKTGDEVYHQLRRLIVRGRLSAGTRLVEAEQAERLGVSRTPVRWAIVKLRQEGYVVPAGTGRQSRMLIAPLTSQDARELFWINGELEALAAWWAAERTGPDREGLLIDLRRINQDLQAIARQDDVDPSQIFELDSAFHSCFMDAGAGPRLRAMHATTRPQVERYLRFYVTALVGRIDSSVEEHHALLDALSEGDSEAAACAVRMNWRNGTERMIEVIRSLGELGDW